MYTDSRSYETKTYVDALNAVVSWYTIRAYSSGWHDDSNMNGFCCPGTKKNNCARVIVKKNLRNIWKKKSKKKSSKYFIYYYFFF